MALSMFCFYFWKESNENQTSIGASDLNLPRTYYNNSIVIASFNRVNGKYCMWFWLEILTLNYACLFYIENYFNRMYTQDLLCLVVM